MGRTCTFLVVQCEKASGFVRKIFRISGKWPISRFFMRSWTEILFRVDHGDLAATDEALLLA